ncbi:hypothetical protein H311_04089 [Anncaliia algerae PRA109]|nr:hypothetical protein H311_04089 [Anncaliia algerae PRA109]
MNKNLRDLFSPHIDSFNHFLLTLPELVSKISPYEIIHEGRKLTIYVTNFVIHKPFLNEKEFLSLDRRLMPRECRNRLILIKEELLLH